MEAVQMSLWEYNFGPIELHMAKLLWNFAGRECEGHRQRHFRSMTGTALDWTCFDFFGTDIYLAGSHSPCHILYWSQEKKDLHRDDVADWEPQDPPCHRVMFGQSAPSVDHSEDFIEKNKLITGGLWLTIHRNKKKQVLFRYSYTYILFIYILYLYYSVYRYIKYIVKSYLAPRFHCQAHGFNDLLHSLILPGRIATVWHCDYITWLGQNLWRMSEPSKLNTLHLVLGLILSCLISITSPQPKVVYSFMIVSCWTRCDPGKLEVLQSASECREQGAPLRVTASLCFDPGEIQQEEISRPFAKTNCKSSTQPPPFWIIHRLYGSLYIFHFRHVVAMICQDWLKLRANAREMVYGLVTLQTVWTRGGMAPELHVAHHGAMMRHVSTFT